MTEYQLQIQFFKICKASFVFRVGASFQTDGYKIDKAIRNCLVFSRLCH